MILKKDAVALNQLFPHQRTFRNSFKDSFAFAIPVG
jgi:hypothetical protein